MLRIFPDLFKHLFSPFFFPSRKITHTGQKEILRSCLVHHFKLAFTTFSPTEIRYSMPPLHIIPCIAIIAAYRAADAKVHILDIAFYTNTHSSPHKKLWTSACRNARNFKTHTYSITASSAVYAS